LAAPPSGYYRKQVGIVVAANPGTELATRVPSGPKLASLKRGQADAKS
jgi:hypothetical protein